MRLSLRARLLLLTAGLLLTGLAVSGTVVLDQLERYQLSRTDTQLRSFATIMSQVTPQRPPGDGAARPDLLDSALDLLGTPYVVFLSPDGKVVNGILSSRVSRVTLPDGLRTVPADGIGVSLPAADGSGRWRAVARPAAGGAGTVIAAAPLTEADATLARVRTVALTSGGLLLALLTVAGCSRSAGGCGRCAGSSTPPPPSPAVTSPSAYPMLLLEPRSGASRTP